MYLWHRFRCMNIQYKISNSQPTKRNKNKTESWHHVIKSKLSRSAFKGAGWLNLVRCKWRHRLCTEQRNAVGRRAPNPCILTRWVISSLIPCLPLISSRPSPPANHSIYCEFECKRKISLVTGFDCVVCDSNCFWVHLSDLVVWKIIAVWNSDIVIQ